MMPSGAGDQFNLSKALVPDLLLNASTPNNNCWADFLSHSKQIPALFLEALAATFSRAGERVVNIHDMGSAGGHVYAWRSLGFAL